MRKPLLSRGVLIFSVACLVCLLAATATLSEHENESHATRFAVLTDWTQLTTCCIRSMEKNADRMAAAGRDPRAMFSELRREPATAAPAGAETDPNILLRSFAATGASTSVLEERRRACTPQSSRST